MPRYLVERTFADGLGIPPGRVGQRLMEGIVACNTGRNVTWVYSYVSKDDTRSFDIYDAPNPESLRLCARTIGLPVDRITEVSVLDPHAYHPGLSEG